jgi:hypothetical protein
VKPFDRANPTRIAITHASKHVAPSDFSRSHDTDSPLYERFHMADRTISTGRIAARALLELVGRGEPAH